MNSWESRTLTFDWLRRYAAEFDHFGSSVEWLYAIGVIPNDVRAIPKMPNSGIKTELNPDVIPAGYLAASARDFDLMGRANPNEFLDAIECELAGSERHNAVSDLLMALGKAQERSVQEDDSEETSWT